MTGQTKRNRPNVYVSPRGTRYVKVNELLASDSVKEKIRRMSEIVRRDQEDSGNSR